MKNTIQSSVTFHGVTAEQYTAIQALLKGEKYMTTKTKTATTEDTTDTDDEETDDVDMTTLKKTAGKKTKTTKPAKTVSDDEDEDFGTEEMGSADLDEETETDEDAEDEDEATLTFDEVKAAVNKYGNKNADQMRAILHGFNLKSTKELERNKKYWEPVYRKVMAKMKKK